MKQTLLLVGLTLISFNFYAQEIIYDVVPKKGEEWKKRVDEITKDSAVWNKSPEKRIAYQRNFTGLKIGTAFPVQDFLDINGELITKDVFINKTVVINYWFVGCRGCKQEESNLKEITNTFKDNKQLVFISFCRSSEKAVRNYHKKHGDVGYMTVASIDKKTYDQLFNIVTYPTHSIVKNGIVIDNFTENLSFPGLMHAYIEIIKKHLE